MSSNNIDLALIQTLIREAEAKVEDHQDRYDSFNARLESVERHLFNLEREFDDLPGDISHRTVEMMKARKRQLEGMLDDGLKQLEDIYQGLCSARQRRDDLNNLADSLKVIVCR